MCPINFDFSPLEWDYFITNCGFTDKEIAVISLKRRGWRLIDIGQEMKNIIGYEVSERTISRWVNKINNKILKAIKWRECV